MPTHHIRGTSLRSSSTSIGAGTTEAWTQRQLPLPPRAYHRVARLVRVLLPAARLPGAAQPPSAEPLSAEPPSCGPPPSEARHALVPHTRSSGAPPPYAQLSAESPR